MIPDRSPRTRLSRSTAAAIYYRDCNVVDELIGKRSFVDVFYRQLLAADPSPAQSKILDAVLVTLMEHGLTPSAIAGRLVYSSSPENIQAGVAAGLLAVGSRFVGTMENCADILERLNNDDEAQSSAAAIVAEHRMAGKRVPGFGHHIHRPDDPRAARLLELAGDLGTAGPYQASLMSLARAVDESAGRHITINATGAVAALLGDIDVPARVMRGIAVLARAAGLVTHIAEEQQDPIDRHLWAHIDDLVPFEEG